MRPTRSLALLAAAAGMVLLLTPPARVAAADTIAHFTALAANLSNVGRPGATAQVDIRITRWSTPEEREKLRTTLMEQGTEKLFDALQHMDPVGSLSVNQNVGWPLRYAIETQSAGKRRVVFATDRPIAPGEAAARPRTMEYRFTIGDLKLGADGKGEGSLAVAVRVRYNEIDKLIELENYASEPIRLLHVQSVK